jgi:hypothetical protein
VPFPAGGPSQRTGGRVTLGEACQGAGDLLNPYQLCFLRRLVTAKVSFLVVGGQAKHAFDGGWDIDLWCDISDPQTSEALRRVVVEWLREHPTHRRPGMAEDIELGAVTLTQGKMLAIPDKDVLYLRDGECCEVGRATGIELILGSIHNLDFAAYAARAVFREADTGLNLPCVSPDDIPSSSSEDQGRLKPPAALVAATPALEMERRGGDARWRRRHRTALRFKSL